MKKMRLLTAAASVAAAVGHADAGEDSSLTMMGELRAWGGGGEEEMRRGQGLTEVGAISKASEVMKDVCLETVRLAEEGVKSEEDSMRLAGSVAPSCFEGAKKRLGDVAAQGSPVEKTVQSWCSNLDGRLTLALETGFFFARDPAGAEREAGEQNPYTYATRRQFCERFGKATSQKAAALEAELTKAVASKRAAQLAKEEKDDEATLERAKEAEQSAAAVSMSAKKEEVEIDKEVAAEEKQYAAWAAERKLQASKVTASLGGNSAGGQQKGIDMLHLVQVLTERADAWGKVCEELLTGLASEEGSVSDEEVFGEESPNMHSGLAVLTFNGGDQSRIRRCATQLKVIGIDTGLLHSSAAAQGREGAFSQLDTAASEDAALGAALGAADSNTLEALVESPWARDACIDLARGYLTARLALAKESVVLTPPQFCPRYARDLQSMKSNEPLVPTNALATQKQVAAAPSARAPERAAAAGAAKLQASPPAGEKELEEADALAAAASPPPQETQQQSANHLQDMARLRARGREKAWEVQRQQQPAAPQAAAAAGQVVGAARTAGPAAVSGVQGKVLAARAVSLRATQQQQMQQQPAESPRQLKVPQHQQMQQKSGAQSAPPGGLAAAASHPVPQPAAPAVQAALPQKVAIEAHSQQKVALAAQDVSEGRVLTADEGGGEEDAGADFWAAGF
eukprot:TRINITY_DN341_c4_g1_i1.p1 TRINITY_DN341_c4_g1~~TRINITY_DN341_c4_g1_i1.p1  ORF type:complete len:685 (-),score=255.92 TRINITY_DN341_c4_g1_i1:95-2149(-)